MYINHHFFLFQLFERRTSRRTALVRDGVADAGRLVVTAAAPSPRPAIPRLAMAVADVADVGADTIVDVHAYALPDARVVDVVTLRPRRWPEETSTAERDETGRVAWRALPTLCAYLASNAGQRLVRERRRVLELGAGLGTPGLLCWRSGAARETTATDGNKEVVDDLKRSIEMNRARVGDEIDALGSIEARELAWGSKMGGDVKTSAPLVIASDVVYSERSVREVLECVDGMLEEGGIFILGYVSRWWYVDRALHEALTDGGWSTKASRVANFDEICKTESIFDRPCLLIIERGRPGTTNCAIRAEEPSSSANREWFDDTDGRFLITPMDALTESFYADLCEALDTHGDRITSLEINGKGPFRIERDTLRVALDAFATRASETKLSALKICHCWLDAECWRGVGNFLAGAKTIQTLEIHDEDIDEDSMRAMATGEDARWTADLKRLSFRRCERFKTAAARALRSAWFPAGASNLESFEISYCAIEDEGVSALCEMNLEGVRQLRFANVEISMLGGADVSRTLGSCRYLRELDVSGNDEFGAFGAAELADFVGNVGETLVTLDLRGCNLGDNGLTWLCEAPLGFRATPRLETLRLGSNGIGDDSMEALATLLQHPSLRALQHLDLSMNAITWRGAFDFTDAWSSAPGGPSLRSLSLRGNPIGDDGVDAITDIIDSDVDATAFLALESLDLTHCDLASPPLALAEALASPRARRRRRPPRPSLHLRPQTRRRRRKRHTRSHRRSHRSISSLVVRVLSSRLVSVSRLASRVSRLAGAQSGP